ncbi:MAG: SDR family oxidoreductase [Alphaproteobacteria bacterium]|nr:SDR family oxidoreductase [Alphaproteobacteria bacterium]
MQDGLEGKVALVTGASRGIGHAIAERLVAGGMKVALVARTKAELDANAARLGANAFAHAADLREAAACTAAIDATLAHFGHLDLLVNNAGATKRGAFADLADGDFFDGFALKFHACVRLTRAAWPALKARGGAIVNIIGAGGKTPAPDFTIGGPVNSALMNFTKAMAQLGNRDGVRVNAINPGSIETQRLTGRLEAAARAAGIPLDEARKRNLAELNVPRFGTPAEIAEVVAFLAGGRAAYMQGALVDVDGGVTRGLF